MTLRFGILGAARIAPKALTVPAQQVHTAEMVLVAARDRARAETFAAEHGVAGVADSYQAVIDSPDVDVVYNPLPMHLHAEWTIAALRAGKHVLCEKPFASNAAEAAEMVRVADETGMVLGEAFHHVYHPMFRRIIDLIAAGTIGNVVRAEGYFNISIPQPDIRWDYATSGGSLMDLGCYSTIWVRHVLQASPDAGAAAEPDVVHAVAEEGPEHIDAQIQAELVFPNEATGRVESSMVAETPDIRLEVMGTKGSLTAINPLAPQNGNALTIRTDRGETSGQIVGGTTYEHMVRAFCDHVTHGTRFPTKGGDSIANMAAIDAMYSAAGLPLRGA